MNITAAGEGTYYVVITAREGQYGNSASAATWVNITYRQPPAPPVPQLSIIGNWGGAYIHGSFGSLPGRPNFSISSLGNNSYHFTFPDDRTYSANAYGNGGTASRLTFSNGSSWYR